MIRLNSSIGLSYYTESMYDGISDMDNPSLLYISGLGECADEHIVIDDYFVFTEPHILSLAGESIKRLTLGGRVDISPTALRYCPNLESIEVVSDYPYAISVVDGAIVKFDTVICMSPRSRIPTHPEVKTLGARVLSAYHDRREIRIPDGIEVLGMRLCYECRGLEVIHLPRSLRYIGEGAFEDSPLTTIYYAGSMEEWNSLKSANPTYAHFDEGVEVVFGG